VTAVDREPLPEDDTGTELALEVERLPPLALEDTDMPATVEVGRVELATAVLVAAGAMTGPESMIRLGPARARSDARDDSWAL
jgi:hypothetical protein